MLRVSASCRRAKSLKRGAGYRCSEVGLVEFADSVLLDFGGAFPGWILIMYRDDRHRKASENLGATEYLKGLLNSLPPRRKPEPEKPPNEILARFSGGRG